MNRYAYPRDRRRLQQSRRYRKRTLAERASMERARLLRCEHGYAPAGTTSATLRAAGIPTQREHDWIANGMALTLAPAEAVHLAKRMGLAGIRGKQRIRMLREAWQDEESWRRVCAKVESILALGERRPLADPPHTKKPK